MKKKYKSWFHSLIGIGINLVLFIAKLVTGMTIQSIALVNDGFNHLSDTATSFVMLFGFLYGDRKADDNHPHGHGRAEYVATLIIGILILLLSVQLFFNALNGLMTPYAPTMSFWVYMVLIISMLVKLGMYVYFTHLHRITRSLPYRAVAVDAINDVLITAFVGLGAFFSTPEWRWDAIAGLLISGFIFINGFRILYEAFQSLMGEKTETSLLIQLKQKIESHPGILGAHSLSYHDYGPLHRVVTIHVELPYTLSLTESHTLIDQLEIMLEKEFPIEIVIHVDPIQNDEQVLKTPLKEVTSLVHQLFPYVEIKKFRMVNVPKFPELIFHVEGLKGSERNIHLQKQMIKKKIEDSHLAYRVYIE